MVLMSVKKEPTLAEKGYRILRDAILSGQLAQGSILTEEQLSEMLSISRTPIRTALGKLVDEGLLENRGKGIAVSSLTEQDISDICLVRTHVESLVISQLEGKICPEMIKELKSLIAHQDTISLESPEGSLAYINDDYTFHTTLARWTGNRYLMDLVERINIHSNRALMLSISLHYAHKLAVEEHRAIIKALEDRNFGEAQKALKFHLSSIQERFFHKDE